LFDALRWLFGIIHPAWSLVIAAAFFFGSVAWFRYNVARPELQILAYYVGGIPATIFLAAGFLGWLQRRERTRFFSDGIDLDRIRALSWQEFERRVADVFRHRGYLVEETGGGGADGGVDLRLRRDGETTLVQCKHWNVYKVGVRPIRELFGVMAAESAGRAILITSGVYTEEARHFAEDKPVELIDGRQLAKMFRDAQGADSNGASFTTPSECRETMVSPTADKPHEPASSCSSEALKPSCPVCGSPMEIKKAKHGIYRGEPFWSCSTFPKCRGMRRLSVIQQP
jgi:restriction system protein